MTAHSTVEIMPGRLEELSPGSARHGSRLALLLVLSLTVHATVLGLWPITAAMVTGPTPAGPLAVQLQRTRPADGPIAAAQTAKPGNVQWPTRPQTAQADRRAARPATSSQTTQAKPDISAPIGTAAKIPETTAAPHRDTQASPGRAAVESRLNSRLQHALIAHFDYPLLARRRGWEGVVQVGLRVEADGQLSSLRLIGSSGYSLLDRAALHSLARVGQLPDVTEWLRGRHFDMVLPIRYQLIDS